MAPQKNSGGQSTTSNKISIETCLEALALMQQQMRVILPYVPEHLSSQIRIPEIGLPRNQVTVSVPPQKKMNGYTKIVAAKQNSDGTVTKMFALRKDIKQSDNSSNYSTESNSKRSDFKNDPILVNSQIFLENFKSGVLQRELNKNKKKFEVRPPCKPIKFPSITHQTPETPLQHSEEPNILKEQPSDCQPYAKNQKSINLFRSKEEAERFMMFTIKEIIQLFSQIANAFKLDAVKRMNYPPTDISQKAYVVECCMQTMRELQVLVNGPVKNLRNELTEKFITVLPELSCVFENVKRLDDLNNITFLNTESVLNGYQRERAPGDGC